METKVLGAVCAVPVTSSAPSATTANTHTGSSSRYDATLEPLASSVTIAICEHTGTGHVPRPPPPTHALAARTSSHTNAIAAAAASHAVRRSHGLVGRALAACTAWAASSAHASAAHTARAATEGAAPAAHAVAATPACTTVSWRGHGLETLQAFDA